MKKSNLLNAMEIIKGLELTADDFTINVMDILEALKDYEVTEIPVFTDDEEYEEQQNVVEIEKNNVDNMISFLEDCYEYEETYCNNTYNWSAPINRDFYYHIYQSKIYDTIYITMAVHVYGDVRCNYTNEFLLQFDSIEEFYEVLGNNSKYYTIEVDYGVEYYVNVDLFNDGTMVNDEWFDTSDFTTIEELQKHLEAEYNEENN